MVISPKLQFRINLFLTTIVLVAITVISLYSLGYLDELQLILAKDNYIFYLMILIVFLAEMVAGSMGMGYGVICTTTLLFVGIPPHAVSASIHSAESFTTAAGSISHVKLKNVSKNLVKN